jgi:hypothetical protein
MKLHRPDVLQRELKAFLFRGLSFKLEYGWNSPAEELNKKESLIFRVQKYDLNIATNGEVDFKVYGVGHSDSLLEHFLGNEGSADDLTTEEEKRKIKEIAIELQDAVDTIQNVTTDSTVTAEEKIKNMTEAVDIKRYTKQFMSKIKTNLDIVKTNKFRMVDFKGKQRKVISFHYIFDAIFAPAIKAYADLMPIDSVRVAYGSFNANAGNFADSSIADFPILMKKLNNKVVSRFKNGAPTIKQLLQIIFNEFFHEGSWYTTNVNTENFRTPQLRVELVPTVRKIQTGEDNSEERFLDIIIYDDEKDTLSNKEVVDSQGGSTSEEDIDNNIQSRGGFVPIFKIGNYQSFIKNISISTNMDESMRTVYISRNDDIRGRTTQDATVENANNVETAFKSLTLPFAGTLELVGCVEWKPAKIFKLSTGIYMVDNLYLMNSVKHTISKEGFFTNIQFLPTK